MFAMGPALSDAFTMGNVPTPTLLNWMERRGLMMEQLTGIIIQGNKYVVGIMGRNTLTYVENPLFDLPNKVRPAIELGCPAYTYGSHDLCNGCTTERQRECRGE